MKEEDSDFIPNTTQVPNKVLDWMMAELTGAELKVLLFFIRQRYGFKLYTGKFSYSLNEIQDGIERNVNGEVKKVCSGTGLGRDAVISAIRGLIDHGHVLGISMGFRRKQNVYELANLKSENTTKEIGIKSENTTSYGRENRLVIVGKTDPLRNQGKPRETNDVPKTKKERKTAIQIQIVIDSYFSSNGNNPDISSGHAICLSKIWAEYGEEKYKVTVAAWAKQKQKDGTPHPVAWLCSAPDQYFQKSKLSARKTSPAHLGESTVEKGW